MAERISNHFYIKFSSFSFPHSLPPIFSRWTSAHFSIENSKKEKKGFLDRLWVSSEHSPAHRKGCAELEMDEEGASELKVNSRQHSVCIIFPSTLSTLRMASEICDDDLSCGEFIWKCASPWFSSRVSFLLGSLCDVFQVLCVSEQHTTHITSRNVKRNTQRAFQAFLAFCQSKFSNHFSANERDSIMFQKCNDSLWALSIDFTPFFLFLSTFPLFTSTSPSLVTTCVPKNWHDINQQ